MISSVRLVVLLLAFVSVSLSQSTVINAVIEYEAKDSQKYATLTVKPEIAPVLRFLFPPETRIYEVEIVHNDASGGKTTRHILDMTEVVAVPTGSISGPGVAPTWHGAMITLPAGGPPKSVKVYQSIRGTEVTVGMVK